MTSVLHMCVCVRFVVVYVMTVRVNAYIFADIPCMCIRICAYMPVCC